VIYAVKTDKNMYCYYDYDANLGGFVLESEWKDFMDSHDVCLLEGTYPLKKVETYVYSKSIEKEFEKEFDHEWTK
jgi:hypothetical protein